MNDFVTSHRDEHPELDNFLGFMENGAQAEDVQMESEQMSPFGFLPHLELSEIFLGVKEGRFFQGRLNVSRLTIEEATINVQGLTQEILIPNFTSQNRACNGDIVAIEVLPKNQWLKNYKSMGPAIDKIDSDEEQGEIEDLKTSPIMQQINESKLKVTGRVIGIIKKFSKTYGGSILS